MNKDAQRVAIAEACGFEWRAAYHSTRTGDVVGPHPVLTKKSFYACSLAEANYDARLIGRDVPNYPFDLNAMHAAVKTLIFSKRVQYRHILQEVMSVNLRPNELVHPNECIDATAEQRAEAFLKATDLWHPRDDKGDSK